VRFVLVGDNTYKLGCQSCYGDSGWLKLAGCFGEK
jgi:hypothetical protein